MEIVEENGERWLVTGKYKTRVVDGRTEMEEMRRRVKVYEGRYKCSSAEMFERVESGQVRETMEIFGWMQDYHGLRFFEEAIRTAGTPSTTTESFTKSS